MIPSMSHSQNVAQLPSYLIYTFRKPLEENVLNKENKDRWNSVMRKVFQ